MAVAPFGKRKQILQFLSMENGGGEALFLASKVSTGFNVSLTIPLIGTEIASEAVVGPENELTTSLLTKIKTPLFCVTNNERIATDDSDLIVGRQHCSTILLMTPLPGMMYMLVLDLM